MPQGQKSIILAIISALIAGTMAMFNGLNDASQDAFYAGANLGGKLNFLLELVENLRRLPSKKIWYWTKFVFSSMKSIDLKSI